MIIWVDLILFMTCIAGIYQAFEKAGLESTKHVSFKQIDGMVFVDQIIDPRFNKKFLPGDKVISVENHPVSRKEDIEFILDGYAIGDLVTFTLSRGSQIIQSKIKLPPYYAWIYLLSQIIVGSAFFLLGVFVIYKRPNLLSANVWHWSSIGGGLIIMCTWGRYTIEPTGLGYFVRYIFSMAYAFVPTLFLQLSFVFPVTKYANLNRLFKPLYGLSIVLAVWMIITFSFTIAGSSMIWFHHFMIPFDLDRSFFSLVILFGMGNIIHSYIKANEESERRKIRWVLLGLAIGPPAFVLLWQIPQLFSYDAFIPEYVIVILMLIVPVTFSISIVKYNILNIDLIVQRSTVYFIVVTLLVVVYTIVVGMTVLLIGSFTVKASLIASGVLAILIPLFLEPIRQYVQKQIDKKFFHVRYNYRLAQRSFSNELNECLTINAIAGMVIEKLDDLLKPEFIQLHLRTENIKKWQLYSGKNSLSIDENTLKELNTYDKKVASKIYSRVNHIESEIEFNDIPDHIININKVVLIMPIKSQDRKTTGYLISGKKKSGKRFSLEDIDLLTSICIQTGIRIERILLQEELILKREETIKLEELNKAKSFFVSSVSHDLQTPLTSIKMFSELLREKKDLSSEKSREFISVIENESERLSRLIKNVLDLSQIERGVKSYDFSRVDLNEIVRAVVQLMEYSLEQNGFIVKQKIAGQPLFINADKDALISGIVNLVSNAMKYSVNQKDIEVTTFQNIDKACISVLDQGIGIPDQEQDKIFDTFYRSENKKTQNVAGIGLGLTILSHMIKAHGGDILLQSRPGKGSTFTLSFPQL